MSIPVNKTLDEIRAEMFGHINEVQEEYAGKGWLPIRLNLNKGVVRGLIELWCWGLYQLYALLQQILQQAFPDQATDEWLDLHVVGVNVERRAATQATGTVTVSRSDTEGNVLIPADTVFKTKPDGTGTVYRYVAIEDTVLPDGQAEVQVQVKAEAYGRAANATAGVITEISTAVQGVEAVTNDAAWLIEEGADTEVDTSLQERRRLAWLGNNGATKYAYKAWALGVTGVIAAKVLDNHPRGQGTVDVIVKGADGIPTEELLESVRAAIDGNEPVNDDWQARGPSPVGVGIAGQLVLVSGSESEILAVAEDRIRALFEDPTTVDGISPLQIGEDLTLDRLVAAVMAILGVKRIIWNSPLSDVVVADDELAVLESLALTATWEDI